MNCPYRIDSAGLLPHQLPAAEHLLHLLNTSGGALDGSDMGVGKTYTAGAILRHFKDFPTAVVCPAISIPGWEQMGRRLGVEFSLESYESVRGGNTALGGWERPKPRGPGPVRLVCSACQLTVDAQTARCAYLPNGIHCVDVKKIPHDYGRFIWNRDLRVLVFDEAHRCSALDTLQSELLVAARRQKIPTLLVTATPAQTPMGFKAIGYVLGLHTLTGQNGFWSWATRHGCRKMPWGGFEFALGEARKRETMAQINRALFPDRGVRITIDSLGKSFPESQVTAELYDLKADAHKLDSLYQQMSEPLAELEAAKQMDKDPDGPLTKLLRLREEIGLLKVPILAELAEDAMAQGLSVALFVNFLSEVEGLCKLLKTDCRVDGTEAGSSRNRNRNIERFQSNESRVIVTTAKASISLHDEHGGHPRIGYVSPGFSALDLRQVLGRLPRSGAKSKSIYRIIFAADTCEKRIHEVLSSKLNNLDALTDGDLLADNLRLTSFENLISSTQ